MRNFKRAFLFFYSATTDKMIVNTNIPQCFSFKQNLIGLFCIFPYIYNSYSYYLINIFIYNLRKKQKSPIRFRPHSKSAELDFHGSIFFDKKLIKHLLKLKNCFIIKSDLHRLLLFPYFSGICSKASINSSPLDRGRFFLQGQGGKHV